MAIITESQYSPGWDTNQRRIFNVLLDRNFSDLLRESSADYNFLEVKPQLEYLIQQIGLMAQNFDFWQQLSENRRSIVSSCLSDMITQFDLMEHFDPKQNDAWSTRKSIVEGFQTRYNGFYDNVVPQLGSYLGQKAYSEELAGKFGQQAAKELSEIRRVKKEIELVQLEVNDAAAVAGDVATAAHAASFGAQAAEHTAAAKRWLRAVCVTGCSALVIVLLVAIDMIREINDKNFKVSVEGSVIKIAILAFLYLGIKFTIKNYSAYQHLYIVNKQRANVLQSTEAFRTSALSDEAKDSVLLAAVGAAFTQQESGFITTKEGAGSDDADLMKVVETALKRN